MNFYPVFKKEVRSYFISPILYIVMIVFLILSGYFFYTDLIEFNWMNIQRTASSKFLWQNYFFDIRYLFVFLLPLVTMRVFAEEKKSGTIELLSTYPLRDIEILIGKFLGCVVVFILMLSLTLGNIIILGIIWGFSEMYPLLAGYLGLFLLGTSLIACGVFISTLTENQVVAATVTLGVFIFFWFLTWNEFVAEPAVIDILLRFSLFDRTINFFKGIIDTKDVVFFILFIFLALFCALSSLGSRRWRGMK